MKKMELGKRKQALETGLLRTSLVSIKDGLVWGCGYRFSEQPAAFTHGGSDYTEWSCHFYECQPETRYLAQVIDML